VIGSAVTANRNAMVNRFLGPKNDTKAAPAVSNASVLASFVIEIIIRIGVNIQSILIDRFIATVVKAKRITHSPYPNFHGSCAVYGSGSRTIPINLPKENKTKDIKILSGY
jgi:hypothetical protein